MDETTGRLRAMKHWLRLALTTAAVCFRLPKSRSARKVVHKRAALSGARVLDAELVQTILGTRS